MCIVLTTHSMPEADFLADRIGIMVQGALRCIGSGSHLKRTYGKGYKLTITCPFDDAIRGRFDEYRLHVPC